ncbi:FtsW/RodA/SpoVE family cell cycle protein [Jeotgalibacillus proteolyticus]|uniref:Rod shape-determining protein RodA n=1 Tax=Jeotgalibacillus proteolyticus TaxID=2082395 RepID=A0A2S5GD87_9BACL|nr:FtsW/RodA/SpoVE family cell cycle protein [Jeotgalibacillus proteolyticus]PPA70874.1 rod shape-determining protein RodA [Jeotgalibacillus proteolyticus]
MKQSERFTDRFDWGLLFILMGFCLISLIGIWSAQSMEQYGNTNFVLRQAIWYGVGFVVILGASQIEPDVYKKTAPYFYAVGILLLIGIALAPESIAPYRNGAKRWFDLPLIGTVQPSELMKTFYILMLAYIVSRHQEKFIIKNLKHDTWLLGKILLAAFVPVSLIMNQPDLGTSLVFIAISAGVIIVSGISWKLLAPVFGLAAGGGITILGLVVYKPEWLEQTLGLQQYQFGRVYSWLDPHSYQTSEGYNLLQAMSAIGSGEMFGRGYQSGQVYIPEQHTDFIFSIFGEEFGFIGSSILVAWFMFLIYHIINVATMTKSPFSTYLCVGIVGMLTFQVFQNIGMTIQLLPITGLTLPFVSYGGSSLLITMFSIGLIFSVRYHHRDYMFEGDSTL